MKFACPHCDQHIEAGDEFAGQVVQCPNCCNEFAIPDRSYKYWAFLSYSHQDNVSVRASGRHDCIRWAEWLHRELESYQVPKELLDRKTRTGEQIPLRFFPVFQDEKELPINADLGKSIRVALEQSRFLIVICSPRSASSLYVNEEVRYFKQLGRSNYILSLIIDGEPNASWGIKEGVPPEMECFCPALRHPLGADGVEDTRYSDPQEPIAGDVRVKQTELTREARQADLRRGHQTVLEQMKLKLVAGLIGVGFDELVQRDKVRAAANARSKARRLRAIAFGISSLVFLAAGLAWFGWHQRQKVSKEQNTAARIHYVETIFQAQEAARSSDYTKMITLTESASGIAPYLKGWEFDFLRHLRPKPYIEFSVQNVFSYGARMNWSPDGKQIVSSLYNGFPVKSWDSETGKLIKVLKPGEGNATAWRPDGSSLAVITGNGRQAAILIPTSEITQVLPTKAEHIVDLAWNHAGSELAVLGLRTLVPQKKEIRVDSTRTEDIETLIEIISPSDWSVSRTLSLKTGFPRQISWAPEDGQVAVNSASDLSDNLPALVVLDAGTGDLVANMHDGMTKSSGQSEWSVDGKYLLDSWNNMNKPIRVCDVTNKEVFSVTPGGTYSLNPDGKRMATICDGMASIHTFPWHQRAVFATTLGARGGQIAWDNSGRRLAISWFSEPDKETKVAVWNVEDLRPFHITVPIHLSIPNGARVPSKYSPSIKNVDHWNSDYRSLSVEWPRAMAVSMNLHSRLAAVGDQAGSIIIIDAENGNKVVSWEAHECETAWVGWSPDGQTLASLDIRGSIRLWSQEGKSLWMTPPNVVSAHVCWSASGHLISVDRLGAVFRWRKDGTDQPESLFEFGGDALVFTGNKSGSHAVAALRDGSIRLLNLLKPELSSRKMLKPDNPAKLLALNTEGTDIAFVDEKGKIGIWSLLSSSVESRYFEDDKWSNFKKGPVSSIDWNTKGDRLVTIQPDFIQIWDPIVGLEVFRLPLPFPPLANRRLQIQPGDYPSWWAGFSKGVWGPDDKKLTVLGESFNYDSFRSSILHIFSVEND